MFFTTWQLLKYVLVSIDHLYDRIEAMHFIVVLNNGLMNNQLDAACMLETEARTAPDAHSVIDQTRAIQASDFTGHRGLDTHFMASDIFHSDSDCA